MVVFSIPFFSSFAIKRSSPHFVTKRALELPTCYFPNGDIAPTDYACNISANVSACCGFDYICLDNKICQSISGDNLRGTCTDQTWKSSNCPQFCTSQCRVSFFLASPSLPSTSFGGLQDLMKYLSTFLTICFFRISRYIQRQTHLLPKRHKQRS